MRQLLGPRPLRVSTRRSPRNSVGKILKYKRVTLRHPRRDDLAYIGNLWSDPKTMKEVGGPLLYSKEKLKNWYSNYIEPGKSSNCYFLIFNEDGTPVGEVSYHGWDSSQREASLNIKIEAGYRGRGYACEALSALLKFYFVKVGGETMIDHLAPDNLGAKYFLEKFGFIEQLGSTDPRIMKLNRRAYFEQVEQSAGGNAAR